MKHKLLLFFVISSAMSLFAQTNSLDKLQMLIDKRFENFQRSSLQEKLYLQTDKPYYSAGEDIWFKGYLVSASTHQLTPMSRYIYVELVDKMDSIVQRVKIKKDSLGFAGVLKLKPEQPSGYYGLRAYSYWMQNVGSDFFFSKNIYIGNPIDDRVTSQINYGKMVDGKIPTTITFLNASQKPLQGQTVVVNSNWSSFKKRMSMTTNSEGEIVLNLTVTNADQSKKWLDVAINSSTTKYKTKFFLPNFNDDFDLQFFPEGGAFLDNELQTIAFKAIGKDGLSVEVTGRVYTNKNEETTTFESFNLGMGKFVLQTQPGDSYYAIVKSASGVEKRVELPKSVAEGIAIRLGANRGKVIYEVMNQTKIAEKSLLLVVHSRGNLIVAQPLISTLGQISEKLLPNGIVTFSIVDSMGNVLSERLHFANAQPHPTLQLNSDKPVYGKRELVNMSFHVNSTLNPSVLGSYSISVTDGKTVKIDSLSDHILSNLLLTSDIKGYIEKPGSYFIKNDAQNREKIDLLMMTQGWRRFDLSQVMKGKMLPSNYYLEAGQALSGKVLNIFNKPARFNDIIVISQHKSLIQTTKTDSLGRYLISGVDFPDSTSFVLKAKKRKSIADVELIPDADIFPQFSSYIPIPRVENKAPMDDYFQMSKEKYYTEGGMRMVNLDEIVVKGKKADDSSNRNFYDGMADVEIKSDRLEKSPGMSVLSMLSTIAGVQVIGTDQIKIRGANGNPMIMIDGIETESIEEISYLTANDLESIAVFKGTDAAIFGVRGGNGVIALSLKKGVNLQRSVSPSLVVIKPLGYQKPAQFYVPKYEVDSIRNHPLPDLRSTIYWCPSLKADTSGVIKVSFYTADKPNNYSVILEGITNSGEISRFQGVLRREGN